MFGKLTLTLFLFYLYLFHLLLLTVFIGFIVIQCVFVVVVVVANAHARRLCWQKFLNSKSCTRNVDDLCIYTQYYHMIFSIIHFSIKHICQLSLLVTSASLSYIYISQVGNGQTHEKQK